MAKRLAVLCGLTGQVIDVFRDDLEIVPTTEHPVLLPSLATIDSSRVCFDMMHALRTDQAIYGWMIELRAARGPVSLHFAGVCRDDQILLIASEDISDVSEFTDELMRVNNEHVNTLRQLVKEKAQRYEGERWFQELSRLEAENAELQRELASQNNRLRILNDQKNELLGMAAHDLRNPLAAIQMFTYALRDHASGEPRRLIDEIAGACQYMSNIIDSFLNYTAIQSGKLELHKSTINLADLLTPTVDTFQIMSHPRDITIELECDRSLEVELDPNRMTQVIGNLVSNAIVHSPKGSVIKLVVTRTSQRELSISVQDQGRGVPPKERSRVFDIFHQQPGSPEQEPSGFGIGLAIVAKIVRAHEGRVELHCPTEGGSQFTVSLPN